MSKRFYYLEPCTYFGDEGGGCIGSEIEDDFCYFGSDVMNEIQSKLIEINSNHQEILKSYFERMFYKD